MLSVLAGYTSSGTERLTILLMALPTFLTPERRLWSGLTSFQPYALSLYWSPEEYPKLPSYLYGRTIELIDAAEAYYEQLGLPNL